jgi:hypothetical protein
MISFSESFRPDDRIRIREFGDFGSARLLDELTGEVVGPHPLATGWYKIRLDPNDISPHAEWSAPGDRLTLEDEAQRPEGTKLSFDSSRLFLCTYLMPPSPEF